LETKKRVDELHQSTSFSHPSSFLPFSPLVLFPLDTLSHRPADTR
jgi:hypothetical protein